MYFHLCLLLVKCGCVPSLKSFLNQAKQSQPINIQTSNKQENRDSRNM